MTTLLGTKLNGRYRLEARIGAVETQAKQTAAAVDLRSPLYMNRMVIVIDSHSQ